MADLVPHNHAHLKRWFEQPGQHCRQQLHRPNAGSPAICAGTKPARNAACALVATATHAKYYSASCANIRGGKKIWLLLQPFHKVWDTTRL